MEFIDEEIQNPLQSILNQLVFEDNIFKKLQGVDIVLSALDPETSRKVNGEAIKRWLHQNYMDNQQYMRRLHLHSKIIEHPETSIEYFGQDFITHPEFVFDTDLSDSIILLNKRLNDLIGKLIKILSEGKGIDV